MKCDAFAFDPNRVSRFEREAKVLASLNHPHIAALHGIEDSGGHLSHRQEGRAA